MTPLERDECVAVSALLRLSSSTVELASVGYRSEVGDDAGGLRLAEEHGVSPLRISAYRSLGQSRGLSLEQVLRAAFRGELGDVVRLEDVRRECQLPTPGEDGSSARTWPASAPDG